MANRLRRHRQEAKSAKRSKSVARSSKARKALKRTRSRKDKRKAPISFSRLERALRVFSDTKDVGAAARSIRVSKKRFLQAAKRYSAIRKQKNSWKIAARIKRAMPIFSDGRHLAIKVSSGTASLIGKYNSAVGKFLSTNKPEYLVEFVGVAVTDVNGNKFRLETDPNALYRLSSAGEPFESIYRIVL